MNERQARLTREALEDLNGISRYIGERNPAAADRVIDTLIDTFSLLAENPDFGARREDLRQGLRNFSPSRPAHSYVVLCYQTDYGVEINAVLHGERDWPELISRGDR